MSDPRPAGHPPPPAGTIVASGPTLVTLRVNGEVRRGLADPRMLLSDFLTISWINYARRQFTDPGHGYFYIEEILDMTQHWYRYPLQYLDAHPSPRYLILNYDDLILRPESVIRGFYEQFGYPDKPGLPIIIDQAVKETLAFRSDHSYSLERMGFTREQIVEIYKDIFERFNFETREDLLPIERIELDR